MELRAYNPSEHSPLIKEWLHLHKMDEKFVDDLPKIGLIAFHNKSAVVAGFLRQVEGDFLFMDSLISNPSQAPKLRNEAIDIVVEKLIEIAKTIGISSIFAQSSDDHTIIRSKKFNFKVLPMSVIALNLKEGI